MSRTDGERLLLEYFSTATQYYVAARFAASAGLAPVAGALFHYAIEMYLKAVLCRFLSERERRDVGHDLVALWEAVKARLSRPDLERFNRVVAEISRFWGVRYPDRIVETGMLCRWSFDYPVPGITQETAGPNRPEPVYEFSVWEIDDLVAAIFDAATVNPEFFTNRFNTDAQTYYAKWRR